MEQWRIGEKGGLRRWGRIEQEVRERRVGQSATERAPPPRCPYEKTSRIRKLLETGRRRQSAVVSSTKEGSV